MQPFDRERLGHLTLFLLATHAEQNPSSFLAREDTKHSERGIFHCAGIDMHKETVVVTIRHQGPDPLTPSRQETWTFGILTDDLHALQAWLRAEDIKLPSAPALLRRTGQSVIARTRTWDLNIDACCHVSGRNGPPWLWPVRLANAPGMVLDAESPMPI